MSKYSRSRAEQAVRSRQELARLSHRRSRQVNVESRVEDRRCLLLLLKDWGRRARCYSSMVLGKFMTTKVHDDNGKLHSSARLVRRFSSRAICHIRRGCLNLWCGDVNAGLSLMIASSLGDCDAAAASFSLASR